MLLHSTRLQAYFQSSKTDFHNCLWKLPQLLHHSKYNSYKKNRSGNNIPLNSDPQNLAEFLHYCDSLQKRNMLSVLWLKNCNYRLLPYNS